jgi:hypothetical protein
MKSKTGSLILLFCIAIFALLIDYCLLPSYSVFSPATWVLAALYVFLVFCLIGLFLDNGKIVLVGSGASGLILVVLFFASMGSWLIFPGNDTRYFQKMAETEGSVEGFATKFGSPDARIEQESSMILPTIDKQLSIKLAQSRLGPYGAQFSLNEDVFTASTIRSPEGLQVVRVTPLDYSGFLIALANRGSAGYLLVNQVSAEARLVEVPGKMYFSPNALFGHDLARLVRMRYRGVLFGSFSFEIDDNGKPFWIVPVIKRTIGLFGGNESDGIILVDPVTGKTERFASGSEPEWIDRVIPTEIVLEQSYNLLSLKNGWFNKEFGQKKDVFQLSDSYNYAFSRTATAGQTWLVSGVTSPSEADQTLVGVMMINMKTKEAIRYPLSGITEMRAMEIAENDERVRAQNLTATWPILTTIGGEPVFYLFLKNSVQRQRFVYIDAFSGERVAMGETLETAGSEFARLSGSRASAASSAGLSVTGTVWRLRYNTDSKTVEFLLSGDIASRYSADIGLSNSVRFLEAGDTVELTCLESSAGDGTRFVSMLRNLSLEK